MFDEKHITFSPVQESDFEDFKDLRKLVMRPHLERQGLLSNDKTEDEFHRKLFNTPGLYVLLYGRTRMGYIGIENLPQGNRVHIGRMCLYPEFQGRGFASALASKMRKDPKLAGKTVCVESFLLSEARRLYERIGFKKVREDHELAHYELHVPKPYCSGANAGCSNSPYPH